MCRNTKSPTECEQCIARVITQHISRDISTYIKTWSLLYFGITLLKDHPYHQYRVYIYDLYNHHLKKQEKQWKNQFETFFIDFDRAFNNV